jgi:PAS domain S-box-containing protein
MSQLEKFQSLKTRFRHLIESHSDGHDVSDFREGTIVGTITLLLLPIANYFLKDMLPDVEKARVLLIFVQILFIYLSYRADIVKRYANYIGNFFTLCFSFITITAIYLGDFKSEHIAFGFLILFLLTGMFKDKTTHRYFTILSFSYFMALVWLSDGDFSRKLFHSILILATCILGFYIFYTKLNSIKKINDRELALKYNELWFRSIFDNIPVGILIKDKNLKSVRFNNYFSRLTGFTNADFFERGIRSFILPEDLPKYNSFLENLAENTIVRLVDVQEKIVWTRVTASKMVVDGADSTILMFEDITQSKNSEMRLEASAKLMREHNEALEEFSYVISHDLQEPLRMITSFSQIIQKKYVDTMNDKQAETDFGFVIDGAKRMSTLIRDMLEYARWSAKALPTEAVETKEVLSEVLQNLAFSISYSHCEIVSKELPSIFANRLMLGQIFQNLIGNAIKYAHPDRKPVVVLEAYQKADSVVFSIKDNGLGFDIKYQDRVFGIFQRLHTQAASGNGMGLAICKRIIEKQGGRIWVESEPNVGSTFFFELPQNPEMATSTIDEGFSDHGLYTEAETQISTPEEIFENNADGEKSADDSAPLQANMGSFRASK